MASDPTDNGVSTDDLESPLGEDDGETVAAPGDPKVTTGEMQTEGKLADMLSHISGERRESLLQQIEEMTETEKQVARDVASDPETSADEIAERNGVSEATVEHVMDEYTSVVDAAEEDVAREVLEEKDQLAIAGTAEAVAEIQAIVERMDGLTVMDGQDDRYEDVPKYVELLDLIYKWSEILNERPTLKQLRENHDLPTADTSAALTKMANYKDVLNREEVDGEYKYAVSAKGKHVLAEHGLR